MLEHTMKPSDALNKYRERIKSVISNYPVSNPRVFGSVARGEDTLASDLDILVDADSNNSILHIFDIMEELVRFMPCKVHLSSTGQMRNDPETLSAIEKTCIPL